MVTSVLRLGVDYWGTACTAFMIFAALASYYCDDISDLDLEFDDDLSGWKSAVCGALILYLNFINLYLLAVRLSRSLFRFRKTQARIVALGFAYQLYRNLRFHILLIHGHHHCRTRSASTVAPFSQPSRESGASSLLAGVRTRLERKDSNAVDSQSSKFYHRDTPLKWRMNFTTFLY